MDPMARSVGLDVLRRGEEWDELDAGSPFDYSVQGILYCAVDLPPPDQDGIAIEALDELAALIEAAGGRTLALFSSWRGVERAAEHVQRLFADRPDRPLLVAQRGDSVAELVRTFAAQPRASLLGTVSLWQGIDVPGDTCTLVTIDRLPFPRPDDPVTAARAAAVDAAGGSGFAAVQVPRAALLLAQGVGRLIRSSSDRGVVAILDSRLATRGYGATLRATLPPLWYTTDRATVLESLRNLDRAATDTSGL
jgi:ATP-dependent DNA helicase DinG